MENIWKYVLSVLICVSALASCKKNDGESDLKQAYVMKSVQFDLPDELKVYVYQDESDTDVLPLVVGNTARLVYSTTPSVDQVTYSDMQWSSSNERVATVSADGIVTALGAGSTNIRISPTVVNLNASAFIKIVVVETPVAVSSITITDDATVFADGDPCCFIGETISLKAQIDPADATYKTVKWSSSDESIAVVDMVSGVVTGVGNGNVTITATALDATNPVSASHDIYIDQIVDPIAIKFNNVTVGGYKFALNQKRYTLDYSTYPATCTRSKITWESSDSEVATVSGGVVTFLKFGSVTITATCSDSESDIPAGFDGYMHSASVSITIPAGYIYEHFEDAETCKWWEIKTAGTTMARVQNPTTDEWYLEFVPNLSAVDTRRGDNGANTANNNPVYLHAGNYPIICFRMEDVNDLYNYTRNINIDTSGDFSGIKYSGWIGGNNNKWETKYKCSDDSAIFIYNLATQVFQTPNALLPTTAAGSFTTFQIKYADIRKNPRTDFLPGEDAKFKLYWIQTFESKTALTEYLNEWSAETGITYNE